MKTSGSNNWAMGSVVGVRSTEERKELDSGLHVPRAAIVFSRACLCVDVERLMTRCAFSTDCEGKCKSRDALFEKAHRWR